MLDLEGTAPSEEEKILLRHPAVGGVILFTRNFESRAQLTALTAAIRAIRPELIIAADQEGGRVQRFREGFTRLPPMQQLGDLLARQPGEGRSLLRDTGWLMAAELIASGLDLSFAPVLDVDQDTCSVIGDRAFADAPALVTEAGEALIEGMHEAGMAATGKHFPGHGGVTADSHLEQPVDSRPLAELKQRDMIPFEHLMDKLEGIMPAHILFPAVDDKPVGFSPLWLQGVLRGEMGFQGVIFSDDLSMEGAGSGGGYGGRADSALSAGCDMVLVCNNRKGALEVIEFLETGGLPKGAAADESSRRLLNLRAGKTWDWRTLTGSPRHRETVQRLRQLCDGEIL